MEIYKLVEIELNYLKEAISNISNAFSPEASLALSTDDFTAVCYDFLKYQLGTPVALKNFKKIISKLTKKQKSIFLIELGILTNSEVLPIIKEVIKKNQYSDFNIINSISEIAKSLADIVPPNNFLMDVDRGEELVRKLVKEFKIGISGESEEESAARLLQVDSLELQNVKEQIEVKIRKALEEARKKAKAAAKVTRE